MYSRVPVASTSIILHLGAISRVFGREVSWPIQTAAGPGFPPIWVAIPRGANGTHLGISSLTYFFCIVWWNTLFGGEFNISNRPMNSLWWHFDPIQESTNEWKKIVYSEMMGFTDITTMFCSQNCRCHVSNALPWKLTPPSICNNQLYYKVTPRLIVLWLPSHFATTGLHCKMTPHFEMTPNKEYNTNYVENNLWYCFTVFLSLWQKCMSA